MTSTVPSAAAAPFAASSTPPSQKDARAGVRHVPCAELERVSEPAALPLDAVRLEHAYAERARMLGGDLASREQAHAYLAGSRSLYHGDVMPWAFVPKIFSRRDAGYLAWIAETMGTIMEKLTARYVADPSLRARFGFDEDVERATLVPIPYEVQIPIARVDIFLNEETGDFMFCELNTDGSAGMLNTAEISRAAAMTETARTFAPASELEVFDVMGACADALLGCYAEMPGAVESPVIAVVDYAESISGDEIDEFIELMAERGISMRFTDIRDLTYEGGVLADAQGPIDCVWRRVVISEMLEKPCPGADAFMRAAQEGRVPIIGSFRTWPCATKTVFAVLHDPVAETFLTPDEVDYVKRHVPATYLMEPDTDLARFAEKNRWIAKPREGYNSVGVVAGADCTEQEWARVLEEMRATGGIVQAYAPQYQTENIPGDPAAGAEAWGAYANMEGLFLFNGTFGGVFTRCGLGATIGEFAGRLMMPCLVAKEG